MRNKRAANECAHVFISAVLKTKYAAVREITITAAAKTADNASVPLSFVCARLKQVSLKKLSLMKFLRILQDTKLKTTVTAIPVVAFLRVKTINITIQMLAHICSMTTSSQIKSVTENILPSNLYLTENPRTVTET